MHARLNCISVSLFVCVSHTEYQRFMAFMEVHALAIRMEKATFNLLLTSFVAGQVSVGGQQQLVKKASSRGGPLTSRS
jgi:hypothetical protein